MSQRFAAPRRGMQSAPGQELLGVITSHGPYRKSYQVSQKAKGRPTTASGLPAAHSLLSAEGMRAAFSSQASATAILQRRVRKGGAAMGAVEGAATVPGDSHRQGETERSKPALPGAGQKPETTRARDR